MNWTRRTAWLLGALAAAALTYLLPVEGDGRIVLAIVVFSMVMWVSEAVPLAVTALASSFLLIVVAGRGATPVFAAYFDPVVVLLLGGFVLGVALTRHGLDVALAAFVMRRAGRSPARNLLAVMAATAAFSMWISNTASTAIMLPIALGIVAGNPSAPANNARAFVLGVAFAANIGGIATPIGTTANPIALRFLAEAGISLTFFGWMWRALPLAVAMILIVWAILLRAFPLGKIAFEASPSAVPFTRQQHAVIAIFGVTVALWLTTDLHGVPASVVAVVPVLLLFFTALLGEDDIPRIGWATLLLIGGGLALGDAVTDSGLPSALAIAITQLGVGGWVAFLLVAATGVGLTILSSNTAAAVIMVPIAIQLSVGWDVDAAALTMLAAVALSFDFMVPVGTPPNAMAYGTGHIRVLDMAKAGAWISAIGIPLAASAAWWIW